MEIMKSDGIVYVHAPIQIVVQTLADHIHSQQEKWRMLPNQPQQHADGTVSFAVAEPEGRWGEKPPQTVIHFGYLGPAEITLTIAQHGTRVAVSWAAQAAYYGAAVTPEGAETPAHLFAAGRLRAKSSFLEGFDRKVNDAIMHALPGQAQ